MNRRFTALEVAALEVEDLNVSYGTSPVLWNISLKIPPKKMVAIMGPNGAGKTTFLKALLKLTPVLSGTCFFEGEPFEKKRKKMAYVPQKESIDWNFPISVLDLVLMGCYGKLSFFQRIGKKEREMALKALEKVEMASFAERQIGELSGGQKQRIFIARALFQDADLYFMDEPFQGVDAHSEKIIFSLLKDLKEMGKTIFIVHHDLKTALHYFDFGILLNMRLTAFGPINEVLTKDNLEKAYGEGAPLLDQVLTQKTQKEQGF